MCIHQTYMSSSQRDQVIISTHGRFWRHILIHHHRSMTIGLNIDAPVTSEKEQTRSHDSIYSKEILRWLNWKTNRRHVPEVCRSDLKIQLWLPHLFHFSWLSLLIHPPGPSKAALTHTPRHCFQFSRDIPQVLKSKEGRLSAQTPCGDPQLIPFSYPSPHLSMPVRG